MNSRLQTASPAACAVLDWDTLVAMVTRAREAACRAALPPPGEPWIDDYGSSWSSPACWIGELHYAFTEALNAEIVRLGIVDTWGCQSAELRWPPRDPELAPFFGPEGNSLHQSGAEPQTRPDAAPGEV